MKCDIQHHVRIGDTAYKPKIKTCQLKTVLEYSCVGWYYVDTLKLRSSIPSPIWRSCTSIPSPISTGNCARQMEDDIKKLYTTA